MLPLIEIGTSGTKTFGRYRNVSWKNEQSAGKRVELQVAGNKYIVVAYLSIHQAREKISRGTA